MHRNNAFTFIELLVVMASLAILMGLLIPAISGVRTRARATRTQQTATQIAVAWTAFVNEKRHFLDITGDAAYNGYDPEGFAMTRRMGDALNTNSNSVLAVTGGNERDRKSDAYFERSPAQTRYGILTDWGLTKANSGAPIDPGEHLIWVKLDGQLNGFVQDPDTDGPAGVIRKPAIAWAAHLGENAPMNGIRPFTRYIRSW